MIRAVVLFLALLTVSAQAALAVAAGLALAARRWPAAARLGRALRDEAAPQALTLAWLVALVATAGSLFLSEVAHFVPCVLCWYQRIAMYPLAIVLGVAAWRHDAGVRAYALPLAVVGLLIAAYHTLLERFPSLDSGACDPAMPCTMTWIWELGYITIPVMAATAFALVAVLLEIACREEIQP
jgi:disulfide bond formation protein DsbB